MSKKNLYENIHPEEHVKPEEPKEDPVKKLSMTAMDINDCIQHVGYSMEQMGYEK